MRLIKKKVVRKISYLWMEINRDLSVYQEPVVEPIECFGKIQTGALDVIVNVNLNECIRCASTTLVRKLIRLYNLLQSVFHFIDDNLFADLPEMERWQYQSVPFILAIIGSGTLCTRFQGIHPWLASHSWHSGQVDTHLPQRYQIREIISTGRFS